MGARYAQHFLINQHAAERIVASVNLAPGDLVLEIGPGKGVLTQHLLRQSTALVAVEIDGKLIDHLKRRFSGQTGLTVIESDILEVDLNKLPIPQSSQPPFKVIGNLPYNLTSPILRRLSEWTGWSTAHVMVQKEVGDRLCAAAGTAEYGALTVGMSLTCAMESVFVLSETSFDPKPRVKSAVVKLTRRPAPLTVDIPLAQRIIQAAFQQRRKVILNSLSHGLGLSKEETGLMLKGAGLDAQIRAEDIPVEGYVKLTFLLAQSKTAR